MKLPDEPAVHGLGWPHVTILYNLIGLSLLFMAVAARLLSASGHPVPAGWYQALADPQLACGFFLAAVAGRVLFGKR